MQDLARFRQCLKRAVRRLIGSTRSLRVGSDVSSAAALQSHPELWSDWLNQNRACAAPRLVKSPGLGVDPRIHIVGLTWQTCQAHQWLHHLPLPELAARELDPARCRPHELCLRPWAAAPAGGIACLALNLVLPPLEGAKAWLDHLRHQQLVFDPDPSRVLLLRALGCSAWWLDAAATVNGWLDQALAVSPEAWARQLGMPPPDPTAVVVLGAAGSALERGLAAEALQGASPDPHLQYFPGWDELVLSDAEAALAQAGWLQAASVRALRLVKAGADHCPVNWNLLPARQPPRALSHGASLPELRALHRGQRLMAVAEQRPTPPLKHCWQWHSTDPTAVSPKAAVVISLYNYAERIVDALESVRRQQQQGLELIVVDDASSDQGVAVVEAWMETRRVLADHPFVRMHLISHGRNAGLATARNSAFAESRAPWCFVLDADNALFPQAVSECLALAEVGDAHLAVVHPLLAVEVEPGRPDDARSLVSMSSWQQSRLQTGNVVDAMALIRRRAWHDVGGYTHIEGGWEDYDFWCKLSEAGYHGLLCPQILAVYRSHAQSMSHCATNQSWRALSRTLQHRHPWLSLPLADQEPQP